MAYQHSNVPGVCAGFAALQALESRLMKEALRDCRAEWLLECAPLSSPSPQVSLPRHKLLFDAGGVVWPVSAELGAWPLEGNSVPMVLLRHVWQPGLEGDVLAEALRVLRPGGLLVSVSANPWHRASWRELGGRSLKLPSWPHFQFIHARQEFHLSVPMLQRLKGLVPGFSPLLLVAGHKPSPPSAIHRRRNARPVLAAGSAPAALCRAA